MCKGCGMVALLAATLVVRSCSRVPGIEMTCSQPPPEVPEDVLALLECHLSAETRSLAHPAWVDHAWSVVMADEHRRSSQSSVLSMDCMYPGAPRLHRVLPLRILHPQVVTDWVGSMEGYRIVSVSPLTVVWYWLPAETCSTAHLVCHYR